MNSRPVTTMSRSKIASSARYGERKFGSAGASAQVPPGEVDENFFERGLLQVQIADFGAGGEHGLRGRVQPAIRRFRRRVYM